MSTPESAYDDLVVIECVVEVTRDFRNVYAAEARDAGLRIQRSNTGQECQDPQRVFELGYEQICVNPVLQPPLFLALDVPSGRGGEFDPARGQCERSARRISSASTSRLAVTSASDSRSDW